MRTELESFKDYVAYIESRYAEPMATIVIERMEQEASAFFGERQESD